MCPFVSETCGFVYNVLKLVPTGGSDDNAALLFILILSRLRWSSQSLSLPGPSAICFLWINAQEWN